MHAVTDGRDDGHLCCSYRITVLRRLSLLALTVCAASVPPKAAATFTTRGVKCVPAKEHCPDGSICKPLPLDSPPGPPACRARTA